MTTQIPASRTFPSLERAVTLPCGVTAHIATPENLTAPRLDHEGCHTAVTSSRHLGWYADIHGLDVLTGHVYCFEQSPFGDRTYYAVVQSSVDDIHYIDPDGYSEPPDAAVAADRMAELIAELERDASYTAAKALKARLKLAEANDLRRRALEIVRHCRKQPAAEVERLDPAFDSPWQQAARDRRAAFDLIEEWRQPASNIPLQPGGAGTREQYLAEAWRDGWHIPAAHLDDAITEHNSAAPPPAGPTSLTRTSAAAPPAADGGPPRPPGRYAGLAGRSFPINAPLRPSD